MSCDHNFFECVGNGYNKCLKCGTVISTEPQANYANNYWSAENGKPSLYEQAYNIDLDIPEGAKCSKAKFILDRIACDRESALEIGCAPGRMLYWLKWAARFEDVCGVDVGSANEDAIRRIGCHDGSLFIDDGPDWLFPAIADSLYDNEFDYILASDVFEHSSEPVAFLAECFRVLKSGGQLFMMLPLADGLPFDSRFFCACEHAYLHSKHNLQAMVEDAGLRDVVWDKWTTGHDTVSARKL